jgi:hypothetical protein
MGKTIRNSQQLPQGSQREGATVSRVDQCKQKASAFRVYKNRTKRRAAAKEFNRQMSSIIIKDMSYEIEELRK